MSSEIKTEIQLEIGHVLFMDIVSYSLEPMEQLRELATPLPPVPDFTVPPVSVAGMPPRRRGGPVMQEVGGSPTARFWVDTDSRTLYYVQADGLHIAALP